MKSLDAILAFPLRRPAATVAIALLCAAIAALLCTRIHADASLEAMFSRDHGAGAALGHVLNDFGAVDELLVLASIPDAGPASKNDGKSDLDLLTHFGERFVDRLGRDPRTRSLTDGAFYRPDSQTRDYFQNAAVPAAVYFLSNDSFRAAQARLQKPAMREQLLQDQAMMTAPGAAGGLAKALMRDPLRLRDFLGPFLANLASQAPIQSRQGTDAFISPDGKNLLIRVRGRQSPSDLEYCKTLVRETAAVAEAVNRNHLQLHYAGSYAIAAASATAIRSDMISSVVGSVLCLQILFILAYRSPFKLFALAFGPIALGLLLGFGAFSLIQTGLTPMSAVLGGILTGMAIDYSIQYLSQYESARDAGATPLQAGEASALGITPAAFAAWATSAIGFLAVGASSVKSLRDFSVLGTFGLAGAFLAAVALLPMLLMITDRRPAPPALRSRFHFGLQRLLQWIDAFRGRLALASILLFAAAIAVLLFLPGQTLQMEPDLTVMHPRPNPAIEAQNLIFERFGKRDWLIVYLKADSTPALVSLAHRVAARLESAPAKKGGVTGSFGLASLLPDPAVVAARQAQTGPAEADRAVANFRAAIDDSPFNPDAPEIRDYETFLRQILTRPPPTMADLVDRYRRLAELLLPRSAFAGTPVTEAITLVFINGSTDERETRDRAVDGIRAALAGESGATVTGISVMSRDSERIVRRDLPRMSLLAVVVVGIYLALHFRNVTEALLALLPTAFSLTLLLAGMKLAGQKVNMVNLVAAPLLIGIDVDYGIFLVSLARVKRARAEAAPALIARIAPVCHAVTMCAAATIIGFGSLMWTSVPAIRSLGFAVAVGIGACLFSVLFLLTPIFLSLSRHENRQFEKAAK